MIPAIVTLIVGVAIVIISFFLTDGKKEDTEGSVLTESKENLEKQLDQYCNSLVEQKKNELKKKGDEVKSDMKKGLDEVKSSSKKELEELRSKSKKELDELVQNTKKDMEQLRNDTLQSNQNMQTETQQKIDAAVKAYEEGIEAAKKKMQAEIEACESQLSEKAKKQMIDYINKSLTEAYEAYDPEDTSEKAPVTYDEPAKETTEAERSGSDDEADMSAVSDKNVAAENSTEEELGTEPEQNIVEGAQNDKGEAADENSGVSERAKDGAAAAVNSEAESSEADNGQSDAQQVEKADSVVSVEDTAVTDSAFTVVEAENPEKAAAAIAEKGVPAAPKNNGRSRKKKRKKSSQNKVVDIWDEGNDVESQVADMHKKGLSIMEIANKLGIGVGEAKVMIDKINETGKQ